MTDNTPLYNSRIIKNYVEYLKGNYPKTDVAFLLKYANIEKYQLDDEGHWMTQEQVDRFHEVLAIKTDNPDISREVGRYSVTSRASGAVKQFLMGFISLTTAYAVAEKINANLSRASFMTTRPLGTDKIEVKVTLRPDIVEKPYQCLYRLGTFEALAKLFTRKFADVAHPVCIHKGASCCIYTISWKKTRAFLWKSARNYLSVFGLVACGVSLPFIPFIHWDAMILSCILMTTVATLCAEHFEKKELLVNISNQGDAASRLIDQINVSYNNSLLVQEIGQATSMILDINQLLAFIMEALEKRLDFDRGMIMLANREKTRLLYTIGYGYTREQWKYLETAEFHLDNPDSQGAFVLSYRKQIPYLINDIGEIEKRLSRRSLEFVQEMGTRSFICVPIVFKGESLGVLVVDNIRSKRQLSQSDMSLLMGIAPQIAISINNAISYRKVAESEKRFRSLSESAPDIIYTIDTRGVFTHINPAWERILGHGSHEVVGRYFTDFARKDEIPIYVRLFRQCRDQGKIIRDVIGTILHKDGSDRFFSISGAPNLDSEGKIIGVVGTFKDVTDLKESESKLKQSYEKLRTAMDSTIQAISMIVESRDPYTSGHQERVARLAGAIARDMGLSEDLVTSIQMAATLHDVGKISVPAEILSKPKILNKIEMGMIRMHSETGYDILQSIEFPYPIARIVVQHHERMDGSGYPAGLKGGSILLEARILAVSDVVEAMAMHRPYRAALGIEKALEEISIHRGMLYDEEVVDTCIRLFEQKLFSF